MPKIEVKDTEKLTEEQAILNALDMYERMYRDVKDNVVLTKTFDKEQWVQGTTYVSEGCWLCHYASQQPRPNEDDFTYRCNCEKCPFFMTYGEICYENNVTIGPYDIDLDTVKWALIKLYHMVRIRKIKNERKYLKEVSGRKK